MNLRKGNLLVRLAGGEVKTVVDTGLVTWARCSNNLAVIVDPGAHKIQAVIESLEALL